MNTLTAFGEGLLLRLGMRWVRRVARAPERHRYRFVEPGLGRTVVADVYLPAADGPASPAHPLLLVNDGQDLPGMAFGSILHESARAGRTRPLIAVGVHAGDRLREFGIAGRPDHLGRGSRADRYQAFLRLRLLPFLRRNYPIGDPPYAAAGFSLGALPAFDMAWRHPETVNRAGLFSGALWWRSQPFRPQAPDDHRMVHDLVRRQAPRPGLRFWLQAGTLDETEDRNRNGIIDAVDDTLALHAALARRGYPIGTALRYLQCQGGTHTPQTWARAFPDFLHWAFPAPPERHSPPHPAQELPQGHRRGRQAEQQQQPPHPPAPEPRSFVGRRQNNHDDIR